MEIIDRFKQLDWPSTPTIIELGCCDGHDTDIKNTWLTEKLGNNYKYYCLEPSPRMFKAMKQREKKWENVRFFPWAIGDVNGPVTWHEANITYYGSGSIMEPGACLNAWKDMAFETTEVYCCTLDYLFVLLNIEVCDFIWADIQGAEGKMVNGGNKALRKTRYLYTEYCDSELYKEEPSLADICNKLKNWDIVEDYGGDVLLVNIDLNRK